MLSLEEPIAAIATPPGVGGLAVIRVSGTDSISLVSKIFRSKSDLNSAPTHTLHYGKILDKTNRILDEVLISIFHAPKSFTTQESVEISCHGGPIITQSIMNRLMEIGVRMAEPGEFTKRAFLNGRIDLSQAESVSDLIHSTSMISQQSSLFQLSGMYSSKLKSVRQDLIDFISLLELELDFSGEDVEFASRDALIKKLEEIILYVDKLTVSFSTGRFIKEGVRVVIAGKPNAGKSTLLNNLLGHDRAIVSEIAGTTRDTIEESANIDGIPFRFIDTAGIRDSSDFVEQRGVERTLKNIESANLLLYLFDLSLGLTPEEKNQVESFQSKNPNLKILLVGNKSDLLSENSNFQDPNFEIIKISASKGNEIESLLLWLKRMVLGNQSYGDATEAITNIRHYHALVRVSENLKKSLEAVKKQISQDFISSDIRAALFELGSITGETTTDDILNNIFSKFCIGK